MTLRLSGTVDVEGFRVEIDLVVETGETVALVGPNGAGKTTVVRAIAGLQPLSTGQLACRGSVWDDPAAGRFVAPRDRRVGVVFQQYLLFDHLTAAENVAFGVRAGGGDRDTSMRTSRALLDQLEIADVADRRPPQLSGGQAQRVALARALAIDPQVLLLDEPLAALDASTRASVRSQLGGWIAGGTSRLVVTHDPVDVSALADRVVVLEGGAVSQRGTLSELAAAPRSDYVADLMATNLLRGVIVGNRFTVEGGSELAVGAHDVGDGSGLVAVRPTSISLHRTRPEGSPRNVWSSRITRIDRFHDRVRVSLESPLRVAVEVTEGGLAALDLDIGDEVWASVKASEITVVALR